MVIAAATASWSVLKNLQWVWDTQQQIPKQSTSVFIFTQNHATDNSFQSTFHARLPSRIS